jgi:hypothetical protein
MNYATERDLLPIRRNGGLFLYRRYGAGFGTNSVIGL